MNINQHSLKLSYKNNHKILLNSRRHYSTTGSPTRQSPLNLKIPVLTISNLQDKDHIISKRSLLHNKGGVYCFINNINGKQYIGSAKNLYLRLNEHLSNKKSNSALQSAIMKYGLGNFSFCVYEYFTYENKLASMKSLTDLESVYIKSFQFETLYNFMQDATSLQGYKHSVAAKIKMVKRLANKSNHPF